MTALVWTQNQSCPRRGPTHAGPAKHASIEVLPLPNHRPGSFKLYRSRPLQNLPTDHAPPICLQASTLQAPPTPWTRLAGHQPKRGSEAWAEVLSWGLGCRRRRPLNRVIAGNQRAWSAVCLPGRWREGHGGTRGTTPVAALGAAGVVCAAGRLSRQPPRLGAGKGREGKLSWGGGQRGAGQV